MPAGVGAAFAARVALAAGLDPPEAASILHFTCRARHFAGIFVLKVEARRMRRAKKS